MKYNTYTLGLTKKNAFHLMRSPSDPSLPWTGITFGLAIISIWYWCWLGLVIQVLNRILSKLLDVSHYFGGKNVCT